MIKYWFKVKLTNKIYNIYAFNEKDATILAQAKAVEEGRPYDLISVEKNES